MTKPIRDALIIAAIATFVVLPLLTAFMGMYGIIITVLTGLWGISEALGQEK